MHDEYPKDVNSQTFACITQLMKIAEVARPILKEAHSLANIPVGPGHCLGSAVLCNTMLTRWSNFKAVVKGGDGLEAGGYLDVTGTVQGHYWNEVSTPGGTFIFDLVANRFEGAAPLSIYHIEEPPAKLWIPGDQVKTDLYVELFNIELQGGVSLKHGVNVRPVTK